MVYGYKNIWKIAFPILLGMLFQQLIGVTDVVFLGHLSEVDLGASAIAGLYYITIYMLGAGFGTGVQIIIARLNGERKYNRISAVFYHALGLMLLFATIAIVLSLLFSETLLKYLIEAPDVRVAAQDYIDYRIWGFWFAFAVIAFRSFYVGITDTGILTVSSIVMLLVNALFNYALIFGRLGLPTMGIGGAALASVISEISAAACFIWYTFFRLNIKKFALNCLCCFQKQLIKNIFSKSVWTTIQLFLSFAGWFYFFVAIEHIGSLELAASNILRSVSAMVYMVVSALAATAASLTANLLGAGKSREIPHTSLRIISLCYASVLVFIGLLILSPRLVMRIYTDNNQIILAAVNAYYVMLGSFAVTIPGIILFNVVIGSGYTRQAMYIEMFSIVVYILNIWYVVIYLHSSLTVCWSTDYLYNLVIWILSYWYLKKRKVLF